MNFMRNALLLVICCLASANVLSNDSFAQGKKLHQGFFNFYHETASGKVFIEISQFEQPFLFQSSMPHGIGSNDIGLDRGQLGNTRLVQFERAGDKVFLRQLNTYYRANSDNKLEQQAIDEAFASSILWGFKVEKNEATEQSDATNNTHDNQQNPKVYIDYTPFLLSDIHNLAETLKKKKQGSFKVDSSRSAFYQKRSKAFADNTELEATITFKGKGTGSFLRSVAPDANAVTVNFHHSFIRLPDENYQARDFHPFSGFWAESYADYSTDIDEPLIQRVIPRHRLNKKHPRAALSEAVEPIIYYLDAGVPEPIRSALLDGAKWWNSAFEAIGYKNAFQVKMLPSDADPMDVRYNVIQWVHRATRGWSYGSSVIDPRSGEIIKGHVTLGSLRVRQDYLIALGLTSPFKNENTDTSTMKEMALARIRQLSAHEVGHTLGLAHNFSASVNNRSSVMDYPHPLIQLDDNGEIDLSNAYDTGVGDWDKYIIAYGYSDFQKDEEKLALKQLIKAAQSKGLQYMSDPDARASSSAHATGHLWDNGDNPADELIRVLAIREKALADFGVNSIAVGTPFSELEQVLVPIYNFHRFQVQATAKLIAGINYRYQVKEISNNNQQIVSAVAGKSQQLALQALLKTLATDTLVIPEKILQLIPPKAYGYGRNRESAGSNTGITFDPIFAAEASAKHTLNLLLNAERLARLQQQSAYDAEIPDTKKLISDLLKATVKSKAKAGQHLLIQKRVNQQVVDHLLKLWHMKGLVPEVRAEVFVSLEKLAKWLDKYQDSRKFSVHAAHFALLENQIEHSLSDGKLIVQPNQVSLPPGSPIGSY